MEKNGIIKQFLPLVEKLLAQGKTKKEIVEAVLEKFPTANAKTVGVQVYMASKKSKIQEPQDTTPDVEEVVDEQEPEVMDEPVSEEAEDTEELDA